MKLLIAIFIFLIPSFLMSCGSKDVSDPTTTQTKLQRHDWILDSIKLTVDGSLSTYKPGNDVVPLTFRSNTFSGTFFITDTLTCNYQVSEPDTVYFWLPGEQLITNQFFIVNKVDDNSLVTTYTLIQSGQTSISVDYFHAQQ
jgi:hypothetical protein